MTRALIVVDVQNDFCEGGSLAVEGGAAVARRVTTDLLANGDFDVVVATRDWHIDPGTHWSDHPDYSTTWPEHCRAGSPGAAFHPDLDVTAIDAVFSKGQYGDGYSGFEGHTDDGAGEALAPYLRERGVDAVKIVGIATDYCVQATAASAAAEGFRTTVDARYTAGVDPDASATALDRLRDLGAEIIPATP